MADQCGDLVGIPRLDPPRRILGGDECLAVGLPAELACDRVSGHRLVVGGLGGGQPPFGLPNLGLDHRQARVTCLGDQLAATLGYSTADQPGHLPGPVPPGQLDEMISVRVDVHRDRE